MLKGLEIYENTTSPPINGFSSGTQSAADHKLTSTKSIQTNSNSKMTKLVRVFMSNYVFDHVMNNIKDAKLHELYDAGKTDGQSVIIRQLDYVNGKPDTICHVEGIRYFVDNVSAQEWIDFWKMLSDEYNIGVINAVIEDFSPGGSWSLNYTKSL